MKRSRLSVATVVVAAALTLTACSGLSSGSEARGNNASKSGPWKIGYSVFFEGNSFQSQNVQQFQEACKALGEKVVSKCDVQNANGSTSTQISQMQGMINQGFDAILLDANSDTGLNNVVKTALSKGIKVINFDSIITGQATSKVNTNQLDWGTITGKWLVDQLHGKGNILVLNGIAGNPTGAARYKNAKALFDKTPGIKIVADTYASWDQATAQNQVAQILNANPQIDGVWSQGGAMTVGAMIEFQKAGRPLVPMTGEDYNGFLKQWTADKPKGFTSIAPGQPNYLVNISLAAAIKSLKGEKVPATVDVPLPVITDDTVQDYVKADKPDSYWTLAEMSQSDIDKLLTVK